MERNENGKTPYRGTPSSASFCRTQLGSSTPVDPKPGALIRLTWRALKPQIPGPARRVPDSVSLGGVGECIVLTGSQG